MVPVAIPQIQEEPPTPPAPITSLAEFVQQAPGWTAQLFDHLQSYKTQQQWVLSALATNQNVSIYTHGTHEYKKGALQSYKTQQLSVLSALATNQKISIYTHGTHESKKGTFAWTIQVNANVL
jgi:beta-mannanase